MNLEVKWDMEKYTRGLRMDGRGVEDLNWRNAH